MLNMLTPAEIMAPSILITESWLQHLESEQSQQADKVRMYREYYDGEQATQLTDRMRAYMQLDANQEFSINFMPVVVDGLANRLKVVWFDCETQAKDLWRWWKLNKMDARHLDVHTTAIRDGESFVLVEWDNQRQIPRFLPQVAYDGQDGCSVSWDAATGAPLAAIKRWVESGRGYKRRMNVYTPDKIYKFVSSVEAGDTTWVKTAEIPWIDGNGNALGVPLIPFQNRRRGYTNGISELEAAIPIQNGVNKAVIDMLAAADTDGFRLLTMVGDTPGSDMEVAPGTIMYTSKPVGDASISFVPGSDLRPQVEHTMMWIKLIAMTTETPLHYFQISGQSPSADSQQQHESRIVSKATRASLDFGNSWEDVMYMGRRLANVFGRGNMDEEEIIDTMWDDFEVRAKEERAKSKAEIVETLTRAGSTLQGALEVAGYSEDEISAMVNAALDTLDQ